MNESRKFLSVVIASGLDFDMLTPDDVIRHVTMEVLAHHLPSDLLADLVEAGLQQKVMSATLVLDTLGVEAIAEHVPMPVLWSCVAESAVRELGDSASRPTPKKKAAPAVSTKAAPKAASAPKADPKPELEPKAPAKVAAETKEPAPAKAPAPLPIPDETPASQTEVEAAPAPEPSSAAGLDAAPLKPNRSAPAPEPEEIMSTVTTESPAAMDVEEVSEVSSDRMQTYADEDEEPVSYQDVDTSVGNLEPEIVEVEYGDENLSYGVEGDEVTAFGQDS